ncbi:hypothetical protein MPTK1_3g18010 [Marchantia polymorpha subsp. ruderalis]|uniref:LMBR1-like membrane protein n=2 Tax=Marchantia polymorpha TaxID=3197 RepID=A0AAF6B221_MARPO|nr:hypothetical protein MARPO_0140s0040 [Marchantia polymorpha]BBN06055.1 hypothetical protein Mp_3g18010 [Marchantia polymorpha subsp. ruderalis]|eukprot:PTQ29512.1 hypothetical protein MARPO_0140s0040 [Marchantia polymorpha]
MWLFYTVALAITLSMVGAVLRYFAAPNVPWHVLITVGYAWFCTVVIIVLVPADIWATLQSPGRINELLGMMWSGSYWSTFCLTWVLVPLLQGYEDAGDFTISKRLKTSVRSNLILYSAVGVVGFFGVCIMIYLNKLQWSGVMALGMACSNTFGLVTGAFLLGFGLVEIPRSQWRNADLMFRQKLLTHRIARVAVKLDDAHQELSTAIVIAQATSNQMARQDPLRPCMDIIEQMLEQLAREDPLFKPSGGRMGESDMDYDTDEKTMADLRRRLRKAKESYYRYKSDYAGYVWEALELEETAKNIERGKTTSEWHFVTTVRPARTGSLAHHLDSLEYIWRCVLRERVMRTFAVTLGIMSFALIFAEATLPYGSDLSLFSHLIKFAGDQEILVQILAFIPLMYMCICTYFSLIRLGMMTIYYLAPKHTSSVSLLMICSMVARYAAPMCYNFINLIRLDVGNNLTTFESKMGRMADVPLIGGTQFQNYYPIFMVIYTALLAINVVDRGIRAVGSWRRFRSDYEDAEGFDPSGLVILRKERTWLEQGGTVGENVVPLARNFGGGMEMDVEADEHFIKKTLAETPAPHTSGRLKDGGSGGVDKHVAKGSSPPLIDLGGKGSNFRDSGGRAAKEPTAYHASRDAILAKYSNVKDSKSRTQSPGPANDHRSPPRPLAEDLPTNPSGKEQFQGAPSSGAKWDSMKSTFQNFSTKRLAPFRQEKEMASNVPPSSSTDHLDTIFQGLRSKREYNEADDESLDLRLLG